MKTGTAVSSACLLFLHCITEYGVLLHHYFTAGRLAAQILQLSKLINTVIQGRIRPGQHTNDFQRLVLQWIELPKSPVFIGRADTDKADPRLIKFRHDICRFYRLYFRRGIGPKHRSSGVSGLSIPPISPPMCF